MVNIDLCGIAQLLRTLVDQKKATIADQTGANIIISF